MKLYSVNAGHFKLDGGAMFGVVPKSMWSKLNPPDENNLCSWAMRCLLIEDGDRLILIDTGLGNKQDAKFFGHYYLHGDDTLEKSLASHGFTKEDITDVFLTHLHFDHCGGAIERKDDQLVPAFPNAKFWSNAAHWKWATQPNDREKASFLKENILPIEESGQLHFVEEMTSGEVPTMDAIRIRPTNQLPFDIIYVSGHTESMMLPLIRYKNRTIAYMADLLPSQAHIPIPYVMAYDTRPLITLQEKKSFLSKAAEENWILFFEHDPVYECCELQQTEKGVRAGRMFKLEEL